MEIDRNQNPAIPKYNPMGSMGMQEHESSGKRDAELEVNPFLLGMDASAFVLKSISDVRASDVEQALLLLPFTDALRLLSFLPIWLLKRTHVRSELLYTILIQEMVEI